MGPVRGGLVAGTCWRVAGPGLLGQPSAFLSHRTNTPVGIFGIIAESGRIWRIPVPRRDQHSRNYANLGWAGPASGRSGQLPFPQFFLIAVAGGRSCRYDYDYADVWSIVVLMPARGAQVMDGLERNSLSLKRS